MEKVVINRLNLYNETVGYRFQISDNDKIVAFDVDTDLAQEVVKLVGKGYIVKGNTLYGSIVNDIFITDDETGVIEVNGLQSIKNILYDIYKKNLYLNEKILPLKNANEEIIINGVFRDKYIDFIKSSKGIEGEFEITSNLEYGYARFRNILKGDSNDALKFVYNYLSYKGYAECSCSILTLPAVKGADSMKFSVGFFNSDEFCSKFRNAIKSEDFIGSLGDCYVWYNGIRYSVGFNVSIM